MARIASQEGLRNGFRSLARDCECSPPQSFCAERLGFSEARACDTSRRSRIKRWLLWLEDRHKGESRRAAAAAGFQLS